MGLALALHRGPDPGGPGGPGGPATGTTGGAGWAGCRLSPLLGSLSVEESQPDQRSLDQTGSSGVNLASLFRAVRQRFRSRDEDDEEREAQEVDGELGGHSYLGVGLGALAPESSRRVRGPGGPGAVHGVWWTPSILAKPGTEGEERCLGLGHRASMFPL